MSGDLSHLFDMFASEAREYVQALDIALVSLDGESDDHHLQATALDEIFRVAHSLKGMCGMMGYSRMAGLAHAMEESLLGVRADTRTLDRAHLDDLLGCVDALHAAIDEVARTQEEPELLDALATRLAARRADREPPMDAVQVVHTVTTTAPPADGEVEAGADLAVRVTLSADAQVPAARAVLVLRSLSNVGQVMATEPADLADLRDRLLVVTLRGADEEGVKKALAPLPEIEDVDTHPIAAPAPSPTPSAELPAGRRVEPTLRVAASKLDDLMFQMLEVMSAAARVEQHVPETEADASRRAVAELLLHARQLQSSVMQVRMTSLDAVFARIPRLVRDLSQRLGKEVGLVLKGGDTEVDRSMVDGLVDPLVHLVRNAIDHGIEPPEERRAAGKPVPATLVVSARHSAGHVLVEVRDDGRGIDVESVLLRAVEDGRISRDDVTAARAKGGLLSLLATPGISSAKTVTDISGRGVGLDAVRASVRQLSGDFSIETVLGQGTTVTLRLPLTLAIMPALLVRSLGEDMAIPLDRIHRIELLHGARTMSVGGRLMYSMAEGDAMSLLHLGSVLGHGHRPEGEAGTHAVIVEDAAGGLIALGVDEVRGTRDVATRALPAAYSTSTPLLGVGMLPDGALATIVDCDAIAQRTIRAAGRGASA